MSKPPRRAFLRFRSRYGTSINRIDNVGFSTPQGIPQISIRSSSGSGSSTSSFSTPQGIPQISINADTMVRMHSAVAQMMGLPPVIVEINGVLLDEEQQLKANEGRRFTPTPQPASNTPTAWMAPYATHQMLPPAPQHTWPDRKQPWAPVHRKGKGSRARKDKRWRKLAFQYRQPKPAPKPAAKTYPTYWADISAKRVPVPAK